MKCAATVLGVLLSFPSVLRAQEGPNLTFRVDVNYVEIDARVVDLEGAFVRGLSAEDFELVEDGDVQAITTFGLVDIPAERPDVRPFADGPVEPDVASNARDFDGRLYLIVLDDLHTSALRTQTVRREVRRFIESRLGANDLASVVTVRSGASQPFTNRRSLLLRAVDSFIGQQLPSETLARAARPERLDDGTRRVAATDPLDVERALNAEASLRTLRNTAEFMAGIRGRRKALLFVSEGISYDVTDFQRSGSVRVSSSMAEAIGAATRANVAVYTINPQGLIPQSDDLIELSPDSTIEVGVPALQRELLMANTSLRALSDSTGGFAALNTNDFRGTFDRIVEQNSAYYMLGYQSSNPRREGRTRRIEVRVRRPGVQVFARRDYVEPSGPTPPGDVLDLAEGTSQALAEVIRSPLPIRGLTLAATAAPFRGTGGEASVLLVVEAQGREFELTPDEASHVGRLELSVAAFDAGGELAAGNRFSVNMTLGEDTRARLVEHGGRFLTRLDLEPGRYEIRVGGLVGTDGRRGSVFYGLDVPDFSAEPISISGLLVASMSASEAALMRGDARLGGVLPDTPTTHRQFPVGDGIAVYAEVYDNDTGPPHVVDIGAQLVTADGTLVFTSGESRSSAELQGGPGGFGYSVRIPLRDLEPGDYVLRIEARSRRRSSDPVERQIPISVVD